MLNCVEQLPLELVGINVLGYLSIHDIVLLERAYASKQSHQLFLDMIPYCPSVVLLCSQHRELLSLEWFRKRRCRIESLEITLPGDNPGLHIKNIKVNNLDLNLQPNVIMEDCKHLFNGDMVSKIRTVNIKGNQNREVMEQLSSCTGNVERLHIINSENINCWLSADILSRWKLKEISLSGRSTTLTLVSLIVQTCSELTSIKLDSSTVDDATVPIIAQHCPKLEILELSRYCRIVCDSLIALSDYKLPLVELIITRIPYIQTADIARRCSHALSRIHHSNTDQLYRNTRYPFILLPYMTELTSIGVYNSHSTATPLITQHCNKLTEIVVRQRTCLFADILSLCRANPQLQLLYYCSQVGFTDTTLIELLHACPHLRSLYLPYESAITDIGILALSEHCPQLQELDICNCTQVTEAAVLQLLQRCHKLTRLEVSSSSLSEETWTQLDKNTQKRVSRC